MRAGIYIHEHMTERMNKNGRSRVTCQRNNRLVFNSTLLSIFFVFEPHFHYLQTGLMKLAISIVRSIEIIHVKHGEGTYNWHLIMGGCC